MESLQRKHKKFLSNLDKELKMSLEHYTRESNAINRTLRGRREPTEQVQTLISHIDSVFTHIDPIDTPLTLYRGIDSENYINDVAFISTTYDVEVASSYTGEGCCVLVISVPVGAKAIFIESVSQNKDDKEVLLNRGGSFSLTRVAHSKGQKHIFVSYIPPDASVSKDLPKLVREAEKEDDIVSFIVSNISKEEIQDLKDMGLEGEIEVLINDVYKKVTKSVKPAPEALMHRVLEKI